MQGLLKVAILTLNGSLAVSIQLPTEGLPLTTSVSEKTPCAYRSSSSHSVKYLRDCSTMMRYTCSHDRKFST
jgi:hypothetical protein